MNLRNILVPLGAVALIGFGFYAYGWAGVAAVAGGLLMWGLLHFTRLMSVMQKAAKRPIGYVGSAVMLNARLAKGVNLMHVVAMTQALGERVSAENVQPEVYRWTDGTARTSPASSSRASWWCGPWSAPRTTLPLMEKARRPPPRKILVLRPTATKGHP